MHLCVRLCVCPYVCVCVCVSVRVHSGCVVVYVSYICLHLHDKLVNQLIIINIIIISYLR